MSVTVLRAVAKAVGALAELGPEDRLEAVTMLAKIFIERPEIFDVARQKLERRS